MTATTCSSPSRVIDGGDSVSADFITMLHHGGRGGGGGGGGGVGGLAGEGGGVTCVMRKTSLGTVGTDISLCFLFMLT